LVFVLQNMVNTVNKMRNKGKIGSERRFWRAMSMVVKENKLPSQWLIREV